MYYPCDDGKEQKDEDDGKGEARCRRARPRLKHISDKTGKLRQAASGASEKNALRIPIEYLRLDKGESLQKKTASTSTHPRTKAKRKNGQKHEHL